MVYTSVRTTVGVFFLIHLLWIFSFCVCGVRSPVDCFSSFVPAPELFMLKNRAIMCVGAIAHAIGKEPFKPHLQGFMHLVILGMKSVGFL